MKSTELRIGNLIQGRKEQICRVVELYDQDETVDPDTIYAFPIDRDATTRLPFSPIPLTEQWLKRFGFEYTDIYNWFNQYRLNSFDVSITPNGFEMFLIYRWVRIKHVHQLQNLFFSLVGEELEIKEK